MCPKLGMKRVIGTLPSICAEFKNVYCFAFTLTHACSGRNYFSIHIRIITSLILFYRWWLGAILSAVFVVISKGAHAYTQLRSSDITFVVMTYVGHQNTFPGLVLYSFTSKNTVYFTNVMSYNTVPLTAAIVRFTSRGKLKVGMNK
jgi:hypothetical protein